MMTLTVDELLPDQTGRLDPVHHRHLDVHHDKVRNEQAGLLDGVQTVLGLPTTVMSSWPSISDAMAPRKSG